MNMQALKAKLQQAKLQLSANGWTHTHTVMNGGEGNYGSCYIKNGAKFYLNKDTVDNLPI